MKRQRGKAKEGGEAIAATTKASKKRTKGVLGKEKEVAEKAPEDREEAKESVGAAELRSLWDGVDEAVSWSTSRCPFWDMEAMGDAYDAFFADVVWDYDIWDLKSSGGTAPNP